MPNESFVIKHESQAVNLHTTIAALDVYHDQIIVFEATKTSDISRLPTRQPLQSAHTQILSPPSKVQRSQESMDVKFPCPSPRKGNPISQDENRRVQQKSHLPEMYTVRQHPPAINHFQTDAHSHNTLYSMAPAHAHQPSPAPQRVPNNPSGGLPLPAKRQNSPVRSVPVPLHSFESAIPAPGTASSPPALASSSAGERASSPGFDQFCQARGDYYRTVYPTIGPGRPKT